MKLLKGYYAYLAVSGGLLLGLAAQNNWALQMLAFALVSAGALSVQNASRWYMRASIAADVTMAFKLILGPAVIPPCLLRIVLQYAALVPLLLAADGCQRPDAQDRPQHPARMGFAGGLEHRLHPYAAHRARLAE